MYRPLPSFLEVRSSPIEGHGIFTTKYLYEGGRLGVSHIYDTEFIDNLIRTPLGGFINHSDNPNCELQRNGRLLVVEIIKDIKEGEEITLSYGRTKTLFEAPVA